MLHRNYYYVSDNLSSAESDLVSFHSTSNEYLDRNRYLSEVAFGNEFREMSNSSSRISYGDGIADHCGESYFYIGGEELTYINGFDLPNNKSYHIIL